ncbi:MAG: DUF4328 domain-containing protein [Dehalococcoidia bacterium]|nr:DUF4328 domain-containing protein [Dehalococcoidia bacterium]
MRRPKFSSLQTPALFVYILLGAFCAATAWAIFIDIDRALLFDALARRSQLSAGNIVRWDESDSWLETAKGLQFLATLASVPAFIWWTRRATCNVQSFGIERPEFSPASAIWWWFVPIANLVQPLRVLNQAWRASGPDTIDDYERSYRAASIPPVLPIWWVLWQVCNVLWGAVPTATDDPDLTMADLAGFAWFTAVVDAGMLVSAVLAIVVVAMLTIRPTRASTSKPTPTEPHPPQAAGQPQPPTQA